MRNESGLIIALAISMLLVTGCPKRIQLSLYNNAAEDCQAVLHGKSYTLPKDAVLTTDYPRATRRLELRFPNAVFLYHTPDPPTPFEKVRPFDNLILLQIEKDRTIYLLAPTNQRPSSIFPPQPAGFPLKPSERKSGEIGSGQGA